MRVIITGFSAEGYITWTNPPTDTTFNVQTATSLVGSNNWVDYIQVPSTKASTIQHLFDTHAPNGMVLIPSGTFRMGDPFSDGGGLISLPVHSVFVSEFYIDKYEVTKALWDEVKAWSAGNGYVFDNPGDGKRANHPVQNVSWYDAVKWCNARSQKEGRVPAYYINEALTDVYKTGQITFTPGQLTLGPYVKWSAGYRLPTEAEWEKAARGGASGHRFPWSDSDTISHNRANYYSGSVYSYDASLTHGHHPTYAIGDQPYTSPVGSFAANGYGLYDMAGNVFEWCWDWYDSYPSESQTDPRGPAWGSYRVFRGGSWFFYEFVARSAHREYFKPDFRDNRGVGFRSVLPRG